MERKHTFRHPAKLERLPRLCEAKSPLGVTIVSPSYLEMAKEAVARFRRYTGLDVVSIQVDDTAGYGAKLCLDEYLPPRPIVFFDADLWLLRQYDFTALAQSENFCAVACPGAWNPEAFPHTDSEREGWNKATYFNSGLFACDLAQPHIRQIFADARTRLTECRLGKVTEPVDTTDQYFLNWAVQRQLKTLHLLPFELNFFKMAVDWGGYPHIPREIIGLHAAGVVVSSKLAKLQREAEVFGEQVGAMQPEAVQYHASLRGAA